MTSSHVLAATSTVPNAPSYSIIIASTIEEVRAVQRLRHLVFGQELGARLHSSEPGLDIDHFDDYCDHLVVRDDRTGAAVGTYRMLRPERAIEAGGLYSDGEFDLTRLAPLRDVLVETGRSCVHPEHRTGAVINLMWAGIARYLHLHNRRWLAGCASVPLADGGYATNCVWELARTLHFSPPALRVRPRRPYPLGEAATTEKAALNAAVPALLRGYLRLGAWVCGEPAHDPDFDVADFFVLLSVDRVDPRYLRHFLGEEKGCVGLGEEKGCVGLGEGR
jgi:putative hemolysin